MERCLDWPGMIRRKQRKNFERFLTHPIERVRKLAHEIQANDKLLRQRPHDDESMLEPIGDSAYSSWDIDVDDDPPAYELNNESWGDEFEEDDLPF